MSSLPRIPVSVSLAKWIGGLRWAHLAARPAHRHLADSVATPCARLGHPRGPAVGRASAGAASWIINQGQGVELLRRDRANTTTLDPSAHQSAFRNIHQRFTEAPMEPSSAAVAPKRANFRPARSPHSPSVFPSPRSPLENANMGPTNSLPSRGPSSSPFEVRKAYTCSLAGSPLRLAPSGLCSISANRGAIGATRRCAQQAKHHDEKEHEHMCTGLQQEALNPHPGLASGVLFFSYLGLKLSEDPLNVPGVPAEALKARVDLDGVLVAGAPHEPSSCD